MFPSFFDIEDEFKLSVAQFVNEVVFKALKARGATTANAPVAILNEADVEDFVRDDFNHAKAWLRGRLYEVHTRVVGRDVAHVVVAKERFSTTPTPILLTAAEIQRLQRAFTHTAYLGDGSAKITCRSF
ncbi:unnamed protein product [Phytophthora lilii]|uniref:Unnamed protein product n=1 Tax=Phytophthora lilii TaxID=2077276 RepID=A0A9W6WVB4_9STRA|nr:unnamed protein product [Phytophthora lilii]